MTRLEYLAYVQPCLCVNTYGLLYIKEIVKQCSGDCDDYTLNLIACDVQKQINLVGRAFMEIYDHGNI